MINYAATVKNVRLLVESKDHGDQVAVVNLREAMKTKALDPYDLDFGRLWVECFGWHAFQSCRSSRDQLATRYMQEAGPVMTAAFQVISGQIVYQMIMDAYKSPEFIFSRLIPERQSIYSFEKVAGISEIGDEVQTVGEGKPYPRATPAPYFQHLAETQLRGLIVDVTRQALFFDRTGVLQQRCKDVGKSGGQNREKRAVDCVIDENGGAKSAALGGHRYHFRNNSIATYGNNSGNHDWDNLQASNALVDWTDIDNAEQLFNQMVDPVTAEPIVFEWKHLVCGLQLKQTALRIRNATEIIVSTPGFATSGNPNQAKLGNPYANRFEVLTSPYVENRLTTDTDWFIGDISGAFTYIVNWPDTVTTQAGGTEKEFELEIVQSHKWNGMGNYTTAEPRKQVKSTVA